MSTDFTRMVSLEKVCKDEEVCHLYATLPPDGSTSVFFNAHSGLPLDNLTFVLKESNKTVVSKISKDPFRLDNVDSTGVRNVHSVLMTNLDPNKLYRIEVQDPEGKVLK